MNSLCSLLCVKMCIIVVTMYVCPDYVIPVSDSTSVADMVKHLNASLAICGYCLFYYNYLP